MDVAKLLAQLREELDLIEKAIAHIEKSGRMGQHRRGRPLGLVTKRDQGDTKKASSKRSGGLGR